MLETKFMDECVLAICDQANESIRWDEVERLLQRVFQFCKFSTLDGCVNHQQEDWLQSSHLRIRRQYVLDRSEVLHQFCRQCLLRDVACVMSWELILCEAGRAGPALVPEVDKAIRIEDRCAHFTGDWRILHQRHILDFLQRCIHAPHWYLDSSCSNLVGWPDVPREANSVKDFALIKVHSCLFSSLLINLCK